MNPFQEVDIEDLPRTMGAKPRWQRAIVLVAGSFNHFVLATLVFFVMFGVVGLQDPNKTTTTISSVDLEINNKTAPAKLAGLRKGDQIVGVDDLTIKKWEEVRSHIRSHAGEPIVFHVIRDGVRKDITVTPVQSEVRESADSEETVTVGQIGVIPKVLKTREPPLKAAIRSFKSTGQVIAISVKGVGQIFSPKGVGGVITSLRETGSREIEGTEPVGIVGVARLSGNAASSGDIEGLVFFLNGFIIFVGVANLIPLPPLDGGYLAVIGAEAILRRKIDLRKLVPVMGVVLGFFVILNVALLYLDLTRPLNNPF